VQNQILFVKDKGNNLIALTDRPDENIWDQLDKQTCMAEVKLIRKYELPLYLLLAYFIQPTK